MFKKEKNFFYFLSKIKTIHIIVFIVFLIQFIFTCLIIYQTSQIKIMTEREWNKINNIESKQMEMAGKLNLMQQEVTRISVQLYRMQSESGIQTEESTQK